MSKPSPSNSQGEETVLASIVEAIGADGVVKTDFLVLPFGNPFYGRDGRGPWILRDKPHAEKVIASTQQSLKGADMMIDYDHQSVLAATAGVGGQAPASGWVKDIFVADDGIHVKVDWTPKAEAALKAREYRYVSPNFRVSKDTAEVTRLVNAGLTNTPNLELPALAHQHGASTEEGAEMTKITLAAAAVAAALAIPADGMDEAKVLAAIGKLKTDAEAGDPVLASVRKELQLADDADEATVLASIQSAKKAGEPDPSKFVPKAGYDELADRLKTLEEDKILASVDEAVAAGKIPPAMKDWAINLGKKDAGELNAYIEKAVPFQGAAPTIQGDPKPEKGKLTDEEKVICSQLGVPEADFLKSRDEEAA